MRKGNSHYLKQEMRCNICLNILLLSVIKHQMFINYINKFIFLIDQTSEDDKFS
jgi:hypothetical protein